jgi:hypothetical protein
MTRALTAKSCRLARAIARVAHKDEVTLRKPAYQAGQQQPGEVCWRPRPRAVQAIPFRGTGQGDQDGQGPGASRERQLHEHRHDHPFMPPAIGRIAVRRPHGIAMSPLTKPLGTRVFSDRIVARQEHRPRRDPMGQQECDQGVSQGPRRPAAPRKHPMIGRCMPRCLRPPGA